MVSETGTIPLPRDPLTPRERDVARRLLGDADAIDEALRTGSVDYVARRLVQLGYDSGTPGDAAVVVKTLRRAAGFLAVGMQQGIA